MSLDPNFISSARDGIEEFVDERTEALSFEDGSRFDGMMQVAQVNTGGFQVGNAQDGDFDPDAVTQSFTAAAGLVVPLPAGAVIDRILISGNDLVIITTSGSVYLVENGANIPPAIQIGDLTIPSEQIATALSEVPDIQTAAGPQGGSGPGSSGNNFSRFDIEDLGDGFDVGDLLQGLGLFFPGGPGSETTEDPPIEPVEPIIVDGGPEPVSAVLLEEDDLFGVFGAFFGGFEGFYGFEGSEGVPGGPPEQYNPFFVIAGFGEVIYDLEYGFEYLDYYDDFDFEDIFFPGFLGNLGGTLLFNTDLSFLEIFGGFGNDEDGSRDSGLRATGSFNLGTGDFSTVFDTSAIDVLNTGLTSNGQPVLFEISSDGKTLYAYTLEQAGNHGGYEGGYFEGGFFEGGFFEGGFFEGGFFEGGFFEGGYLGGDVLVRPVFEINIFDFAGSYTIELYNNLDHLPTEQGEEILPYNFPFITTDNGDGSTITGFFQAQFQDDAPVLVKDLLEVIFDAIVAFSEDPETDLSQFDWGLEALPEFFEFIADVFGDDVFDIDPVEDAGAFEFLYAFLQVVVGLEYGAVSEELLNNLDRDVHLNQVLGFEVGIDDGDNIEGSLGTYAEGFDYFNPYTEFFEYLFSHDHDEYYVPHAYNEYDEYEEEGHHDDHDDCPDGSVTTYGLLGALFGADYGEAREIVFNDAMAGLATVGGVQLQSKGEDVTYVISEDGTLLQAFASEGDDDEPRLVFEVELTDQIIGAFRFTLFDQLDHATPELEPEPVETPAIEQFNGTYYNGGLFEGIEEHLEEIVDPENGIQDGIGDVFAILEFLYDAVDSDGDVATGSFFVEVWDDEPYYADGYYGNMLADYGLAAHEEGQVLVGRLFVGADEPGDISFSPVEEQEFYSPGESESEGEDEYGLPSSFAGLSLEYTLSEDGRTLEARFNGDNDFNGLLLFSLAINADNLTYSFTLGDNLPALPENGENEENDENEDIDFEDLASILIVQAKITGTDFDGDMFYDTILVETKEHLDNSSGLDNQNDLRGFEYNDTIIGASNAEPGLYNEAYLYLYGYGGDDLLIGGANAYNNIYGGRGDDILIGNDKYDELYGNDGNDILIGGGGDDNLEGDDGKDILRGGDDNDTLQGEEDDDYLDGGEGTDTALFEGYSTDYEIGFAEDEDGNVIGLTVTDRYGPDGKDTLVNIEEIEFEGDDETFDLTNPVLLLNEDGALVGTFEEIQQAVDAADDNFTVLITSGTYNESVTVDKPLHFKGVETDGPVIVTPPSGSAFDVDGDLGEFNTLSFDNIEFRGAGRSGIQLDSGDTLGELRVTNSTFAANFTNGIEVNGANLTYAAIIASVFIGNGEPQPGVPSTSGDGDILFFEYNGNALIQNVQITGQDRGNGPQENGIQFRSDTGSIGDVKIENVTIDGIFEKQPIAFFNYDDLDGLQMEDVTVTADSQNFNTAMNISGITDPVDLSDSTQFDNVQFPNLAANGDIVAVQGDDGNNELTGGDEDNFLRGFGGNDTLTGNGGDDGLVGLEGEDTLNGGAGSNTLSGGTEGDLFVFDSDALDGLLDQVLDYNLAEGDQVDLTDLFDVAGGDVNDFVAYDDTTGNLTVDADGAGGNAGEVVATFTNTPVDIEVLFTDSTTPGDDTTTL